MVIIGSNLKYLIRQNNICPEECYDYFSISLHLDDCYYVMRPGKDCIIKYNSKSFESFYEEITIESQTEIILQPQECVLACSKEEIKMPIGYLGLVQTKGTLARLFISSVCNDAQIEPGYQGKITLELTNHSNNTISIPRHSNVAQMFIFKCSKTNSKPYAGRYQNASKPTIPCSKK